MSADDPSSSLGTIHQLPAHLYSDATGLWERTGLTRPWNDPGADLHRALTGTTSTVLAAVEHEQLLATAMVGHDGHRGWVYYLAVTPAARGRGLGRRLVHACEQWVRARGIPKIQLMVRADDAPAAAFYERLGYTDSHVVVLGRPLDGHAAVADTVDGSSRPRVPDLEDLRVCFLGDSFVAGVGDPEHLGWTGRLAARSSRAGQSLTAYHLGVRRQTSRDISHRFLSECSQRLPTTVDGRVVLSFGVNDTTDDGAGPRVHADESAAHLTGMLDSAAARGWAALVVGPPPVADAEHNLRVEHLDGVFRTCCRKAAVPYVGVFHPLLEDDAWTTEVQRSDGAHPAAGGYARLADLVWPSWTGWTSAAPGRRGGDGG